MPLTFGVLGPLLVWDGDRNPIQGLRPSHRRLLAILLLDAGRTVETDRLIDRFWAGEPPATAKAALQTHISAIRRTIPDGAVETTARGYRINRIDAVVDTDLVVEASHLCVDQIDDGRFSEAAHTATTALERWRGPAWAEIADDDFARAEISRLEELRLGLLERRAEAQLGAGREADALADLEGLVDDHPLRERLWEHLIVARHRLGRHADAVRAFRHLAERLSEIGLEPSQRLRDLEHRVLVHDPDLAPKRVASLEGTHGFPIARTSFVGRRGDLTTVADLLETHRLVTLTGVGGCGKTRLAVEAAKRHRQDPGAEAFFVDLAPLSDPDLVAEAVAGAIGLEGGAGPGTGGTVDAIERALAGRPSLIVVDNCEHLLDACAETVVQLLRCPELRLLATSREPLAVDGEQVHRVPSLSVPDTTPGAPVDASEAVELFVDRARAARSDFAASVDDGSAIAQICRRLDGIPLAIEFAAARTTHLSPQAIAERLDDRFRLLTGGRRRIRRQQTLEATLDWSHELLDEAEQAVLRRLAVFSGSFGLDMAEDVCASGDVPSAAVLDLIGRLVDRSMVLVEPVGGEPRYRLLETVRAYAEDKLVHAGEAERTRVAHRDAVLTWLESAPWGAALFDPARLERLVQERNNIRAALEWSWERDERETVARLAARGQILWQAGVGYGEDGRRWARRAVEHVETLPTELRTACWLALAGAEMTVLADYEATARRAMEAGHRLDGLLVSAVGWRGMHASLRAVAADDADAEELARDLGAQTVALGRELGGGWLAHALLYRGETLVTLGDLEDAAHCYEEAIKHSRPTSHYHEVVVCELATCRILLGDPRAAQRLASDVLEHARVGRPRPWSDLVAALAHAHLGNVTAAASHLERGVELARARPVFLELNECLLYAGAAAHAVGEPGTASTLLAVAVSAGGASHVLAPFRSPASWSVFRAYSPMVRAELDPEEARRCHKAGRRMDIDHAVGIVIDLAHRLAS